MSKGQGYNVGDKVEWDWGNGTGTGTIKQVYTQKRTVKIKGQEITRDASEEEPAYLIEQTDAEVLKSHSEVRKATLLTKSRTKKPTRIMRPALIL